jgi:hypothetical protein
MVPVGFFAKRLGGNDGWLPSHVHEICSVSRCMATVPDDWILSWQHNKYFFFDSEAIACEIASSLAPDFDVFAYRVLPRRFDKIGETEITINAPFVQSISDNYRLIGYDAVECWQALEKGMPIECSPLSCNQMAEEVAVNRFCLIDDFDAALETTRRFGLETDGVEPGPYYLFEVWRRVERADG